MPSRLSPQLAGRFSSQPRSRMRSRHLPAEAFRSRSRSFSNELQFGTTVEHRVIADKRQAPPNGGCRNP